MITIYKPTLSLILLGLLLVFFIGCRFEVGGDWYQYLEMYQTLGLSSFSNAIRITDPAYAAINWVSSQMALGMMPVNLVCAGLMVWGTIRFAASQPTPGLTLIVALPYLIIVVAMGYTRQGVAIGLILAGLANFSERSLVRTVIYVLAAALFHKTALLILPLLMAPLWRRNGLYTALASAGFVILYYLLLRDSTDALVTSYGEDTTYHSGGALPRVAMNVVPALLTVCFRKRLGFNRYLKDMWLAFAIAALATFPLVVVTSMSTAIDRMSLFLIPLQLAILPRLPSVLGKPGRANSRATLLVVTYSALIQFVWLVFGTYARFWVPYKTYLFNA